MSDDHKGKSTLRKIFITGLLVVIPIAVTVFFLIFLFRFFDGWLAPFGNQILKAFDIRLPFNWKHIPGLGILATVLLIFFMGLLASNYLGREILHFGDRLIHGIPFVNSVYHAVRQVVHTLSATGTKAFQTVVMFEYPRPGIWSIGFLTTPALEAASKIAKQKLINVFLPTTPNPTSGFFLMLPEDAFHILPISVEEGIKLIATAGLIQKNEAVEPAFIPGQAVVVNPPARRKKKVSRARPRRHSDQR